MPLLFVPLLILSFAAFFSGFCLPSIYLNVKIASHLYVFSFNHL